MIYLRFIYYLFIIYLLLFSFYFNFEFCDSVAMVKLKLVSI